MDAWLIGWLRSCVGWLVGWLVEGGRCFSLQRAVLDSPSTAADWIHHQPLLLPYYRERCLISWHPSMPCYFDSTPVHPQAYFDSTPVHPQAYLTILTPHLFTPPYSQPHGRLPALPVSTAWPLHIHLPALSYGPHMSTYPSYRVAPPYLSWLATALSSRYRPSMSRSAARRRYRSMAGVLMGLLTLLAAVPTYSTSALIRLLLYAVPAALCSGTGRYRRLTRSCGGRGGA